MRQRKGNWMQTFTGRAYWPLDPDPAEVDIEDIAHALSMACRYGGHCRRFYSVAEHSVHVSTVVPREHALQGLLHDATEAYLADIIRPIKQHLTNYVDIEARNWAVISARFGVPEARAPDVKRADNAMLFAEQAALMGPSPLPDWGMGAREPAADVVIHGWLPHVAEAAFLQRYEELTR